MRNRTIVLVPAVLAAVAAAGTMTAPTTSAAPAAEECATKPGPAVNGGHWKYRTDRSTGRKCWFLAGESSAARRATASKRRAAEQAAERERPPTAEESEPAEETAAPVESQATADYPASGYAVPWTELQQRASALKENPAFTNAASRTSSATDDTPPSSQALQSQAEPQPQAEPPAQSQDQAQAESQDEMPLVWPELTPAELAEAQPPVRARALGVGPVLLLVGGALTLAGMMFAIISLSSARSAPEDRRDPSSRRMRPVRFRQSVSAVFAQAAAAARGAGPMRKPAAPALAREVEASRKSSAPVMPREAEPVRTSPAAPLRRSGAAREPMASGENLDELEARMPWLVRRGNRTAAA